MHMKRMMKVSVGVCFMIFFVISTLTAQEEYPTRAITMVVASTPGGGLDLGARALGASLSKQFGHPVVILNRPGGGTTIGGNAVATAKPDGYTLGFFTLNTSIPEAYSYFLSPPYTSEDLVPISRVMTSMTAIAVKADAPWKSLKDLVSYAKKNPGMKYAVTQTAGTAHIYVVTIEKTDGVKFTPMVASGDAESLNAVLGGHTSFGALHYGIAKPHVEAGSLRVLAIALKRRYELLPDVPYLEELGYRLPYISYFGVFAPKRTPDTIVRKLDKAIEKTTNEPDFVEKVDRMYNVVMYESTEVFRNNIVQYKANIGAFFKELGYVK